MVVITEDVIRLLESMERNYRRGRHPEGRTAERTAALLRALADELDL
jgi:CspA family cold shock protein